MGREKLVRALRPISRMALGAFFILSGAAFAQNTEIPTVDGHLGACATSFTVLDSQSRPVYNAKVSVGIRYGFLGFRKMELQVGTNSEGRARVAGLPESPKSPLEFQIVSGRLSKRTIVDVRAQCLQSVQVRLDGR